MIRALFKLPNFIENDIVPTRWSNDMLLALRIYIGLKIIATCFAIIVTQSTPLNITTQSILLKPAYFFILVYSLGQFFIISRYKHPLKKLTFLFFALDISLIIVISYLLDYKEPSIPFFIYVCVAAAAMILRLRLGLSLAIFTIILVILEKKLSSYNQHTDVDFSLLGVQIVGILFSCYFLALLARRAHIAEIEKFKEEERSSALSNINNELIQELDTGIIVVDNNGKIETCNTAALSLSSNTELTANTLQEFDLFLYKHWLGWSVKNKNTDSRVTIKNEKRGFVFDALFSPLGSADQFSKITLFTESALRAQAQRYSLERMGHMATAIAHEIRNPLTSITAANELLSQQSLSDESKNKTIAIIERNSSRINQIIEDVLSIGQSKQASMEEFDLLEWLNGTFLPNYLESNLKYDRSLYTIKSNNEHDLTVQFSRSHLMQVVSNLLDNAIRHGDLNQAEPIVLKLKKNDQHTTFEVFNTGTTITKENSNRVFEPFYTTKGKSGGTGLGLYLCQQICELNLATLSHNRYRNGNGFLIEFQTNDPLSLTI